MIVKSLFTLLIINNIICYYSISFNRNIINSINIFNKLNDHNNRDIQLTEFNRLRCDNHHNIWHYKGILRNPLTGNEFANIEGLEYITNINTPNISMNQINNMIQSKGFNSNDSIIDTISMLSKKVFIYTYINNSSQPITSYRVRPQAPKRIVNPIKPINEIITITSIKPKNNVNKQSNDSTNQYISNILWPGKTNRLSTTKKLLIKKDDMKSNLFHNNIRYSLTHFISGGYKPKRKKRFDIFNWISFSSSESDSYGRSQEYYTISYNNNKKLFNNLPDVILSYIRYGECPAWYSIGRSCTTEIQGSRYRRLEDIPRESFNFFQQNLPEYLDSNNLNRNQLIINFFNQSDLLDNYLPWYHQINPMNIFKK